MYIRVSGVKQQISRIIILPVTGIHKPRTYIDAIRRRFYQLLKVSKRLRGNSSVI
jgi:hypothetical protein